jgi:hypothetical protein
LCCAGVGVGSAAVGAMEPVVPEDEYEAYNGAAGTFESHTASTARKRNPACVFRSPNHHVGERVCLA